MRIAYHKASTGGAIVACCCFVDALALPVRYKVPAMMANAYVRLAGSARFRFADGRIEEASRFAVLGPTTSAFELEMSAGCVLAIVSILPEGWHATTALPAIDARDRLVDAAMLWPAAACDRLVDALASSPCPADAYVTEIERFLAAQALARSVGRSRRLVEVDRWIEFSGAHSLDRLCARLDIGARQTIRLCEASHGMGPKMLAMKYRALRGATRLAARGPAAIDEVAAGYSDQSHMIRDFHRFVGWTPRVYARDCAAVASATILGRWNAGYRRRMGIWG